MQGTKDSRTIAEIGKQMSDATIRMHEAIARKAGLTGTDHKYLGHIIRQGSMTAGELANITRLTTGAITGLVDRLEKKGLIKRELDGSDRRKVMLVPCLDHDTIKILAAMSAELHKRIKNLFTKLTEPEIALITNHLEQTIQVMDDMAKDLNSIHNDE